MSLHGDDLDQIGYELKGQPDGVGVLLAVIFAVLLGGTLFSGFKAIVTHVAFKVSTAIHVPYQK